MTIHAIYENGVFRPMEKVSFPEKAEVIIDPVLVDPEVADRANQERIYALLRQSYPSGEGNVAERHNEHQP